MVIFMTTKYCDHWKLSTTYAIMISNYYGIDSSYSSITLMSQKVFACGREVCPIQKSFVASFLWVSCHEEMPYFDVQLIHLGSDV